MKTRTNLHIENDSLRTSQTNKNCCANVTKRNIIISTHICLKDSFSVAKSSINRIEANKFEKFSTTLYLEMENKRSPIPLTNTKNN